MTTDDDDVVDQEALADHDPIYSQTTAAQPSASQQLIGAPTKSSSWRSNFAPQMPAGFNIVSGLLSSLVGGEKGNMIANLPETMIGRQPTMTEKIEQAIGGFLPGFEGGGEGIQAAKKGLEYIQPGKTAQEFMSNIGEGAQTAEENISNLAHKIGLTHLSNEAEAVLPKQELLREYGNQNILQPSEIEQPNINRIAKIFSPSEAEHTPENMQSLQKAIQDYYKSGGDIDKLASKGEDIFGHEGLEEKELNRLDQALPLPELKEGKYRSLSNIDQHFANNDSLQEAHQNFMNNASANNADTLLSQLGKAERRLSGKANLHPDEEVKLDAIRSGKTALKSDMQDYVSTLPPEYQDKYSTFTNMYRKHIEPFSEEPMLSDIAQGQRKGFTPSQVENVFANPTEAVSRLTRDIGEQGRGNILFNKLQSLGNDPEKIGQAILDLKNTKGYSEIISPEHEAVANELIKRARAGKIVKGITGAAIGSGLGALGSSSLGFSSLPGAIMGGATGGAKLYGPALIKLLQTLRK